VTGFFVASARADSVVRRAIEQNKPDPENVQKQLAGSAAITEELKKNNLFAPPLPPQHPVKQVSGIFGDQVLINNKWYNVGDTVGDAKIIAIGPTSVTIMWDGKEKSFLPIQAKATEAQGGPKGRTTSANERKPEPKPGGGERRPDSVTVRVESEGPRGDRGGPGGGFMAMRQRFENMSEQERQEFRERMRERFARERGGDFGGRGGPGRRGPGGR
jgi:hypothetical protein